MLKRVFSLILTLSLCLACCAGARAAWDDHLVAGDSAVFDDALAMELLAFSGNCYLPGQLDALTAEAGFKAAGAYNYTRAADDTRHVCAYSVHQKALDDGRTLVVIVIRGTGAGEWPLNVQLMPSGDYELDYAENFHLAARAIMDEQLAFFMSLTEPVFAVTGHSRGAACANVLGKLLTDRYGAENVFCYTFATPRTVRGAYAPYENIFNVINPEDFVTYLPPPQWGFARYGVDVTLPVAEADADTLARVNALYAQLSELASFGGGAYTRFTNGAGDVLAFIDAIAAVAPTARQAYTERHSLLGPGLAGADEQGEIAGDFILSIFDSMLGGSAQADLLLKLAAMKANRTDFDPLLNVVLGYLLGGEAAALTCAHMPQAYGAWMQVME